MLIDTHCHLEFIVTRDPIKKLTPSDLDVIKGIVQDAHEKSITTIITIGTDYPRSLIGTQISRAFDTVFCTVGIHPCDAHENWQEEFEKIKKLAAQKNENKIVGIGESGLDFYHPGFNVQRQEDVFKAHIELALEHDLALVVHSRQAIDETLAILRQYTRDNLRAVIHCFDQDWSVAQDIINLNFLLGIGGIITYPKNEYLRTVVRHDNLANIILETDAPFLPPQIIRGKLNTPAQINTIAHYIADLLGCSYETVAQKTTANAKRLFKALS